MVELRVNAAKYLSLEINVCLRGMCVALLMMVRDMQGSQVGMLLARYDEVVCLDLVHEKLAMINRQELPIEDSHISGLSRISG